MTTVLDKICWLMKWLLVPSRIKTGLGWTRRTNSMCTCQTRRWWITWLQFEDLLKVIMLSPVQSMINKGIASAKTCKGSTKALKRRLTPISGRLIPSKKRQINRRSSYPMSCHLSPTQRSKVHDTSNPKVRNGSISKTN